MPSYPRGRQFSYSSYNSRNDKYSTLSEKGAAKRNKKAKEAACMEALRTAKDPKEAVADLEPIGFGSLGEEFVEMFLAHDVILMSFRDLQVGWQWIWGAQIVENNVAVVLFTVVLIIFVGRSVVQPSGKEYASCIMACCAEHATGSWMKSFEPSCVSSLHLTLLITGKCTCSSIAWWPMHAVSLHGSRNAEK
jgi:hypothetical protein